MAKNLFTIILLILTTLGTRIPFTSKYIFEHDSVNFALALEEYNIEKHQPHPPGYIIYIGIAKLLNIFIKDANTVFVIISIIFSCLAVCFLFLLGKELLSYRCGLVAAIFFIFSPVLWAYGEIALSYIIDAFAATFIAFFIYKSIYRKPKTDNRYLTYATICLGLSAGIRLTILLFLLPLWLTGLVYTKSYKKILIQLGILIISIIIWFIPLIILTHGFTNYINSIIKITSACVFPAIKLKRLVYAITSTIYGLGMTIFPLIISVKNIKTLPIQKKQNLFIILIAWLSLIFLFCFFIYPGQTGHTLIFLPLLFLISSIFIYKQCSSLAYIIIAITIIINSFIFLSIKPLSPGTQIIGIKMDKIKNFANFWVLNYSYKGIKLKEENKKLFPIIKENFSPDTTIIAVASTRMLEPYIPAKVVYYYLREYKVFEIKDSSQYILPENINTIIWLLHPHDIKNIVAKSIKTLSTQGIFFSNIQDSIKLLNCYFGTVCSPDLSGHTHKIYF